MRQLSMALNRYQDMRDTAEIVGESETGTELLIPITSSLYVPGKLSGKDILVDIGTGYYVEKVDSVLTLRIYPAQLSLAVAKWSLCQKT